MLDDERRVAVDPRFEEELLELAVLAVGRGAELQAVGDDDGAEPRGAVVDGEAVAHAVENLGVERRERVAVLVCLRESLNGFDLVVEEDGELAEVAPAGSRRRRQRAVFLKADDEWR